MLEAHEYAAWDHTSALLSCVAGLVKPGVKVQDFHPYRREDARRGQAATGNALQSLKGRLKPWRDPYGEHAEDSTSG
jgi:hypothetical protein